MKLVLNVLCTMLAVGLIFSCKSDVKKAETSEAAEVATASGKDYTVDTGKSKIFWEGSKVAGTHAGDMKLSSGSVTVGNGKVTGGNFVIDMNSINVTDLEGDKKAYLEGHLKGSADDNADDFFNVNKYPTASFEITKVTDVDGDPEANHLVYGNLTLKDVTKQIGFRAQIDVNAAGVSVKTPKFGIDRTEWGIKYGSDKFFDNLADKAINDKMEIAIELMAK